MEILKTGAGTGFYKTFKQRVDISFELWVLG